VKWLLRFAGITALLALPCFWLSAPWQRAIGAAATFLLSRFGMPIELQDLQLMAPFDLGIFLALVFASRRAPGIARRRALEWGVPAMVALEVLTVVSAVAIERGLEALPGTPESRFRAMQYVLEFVPWASATTLWLLLLGSWELPFTAPPPEARPAARPAPR